MGDCRGSRTKAGQKVVIGEVMGGVKDAAKDTGTGGLVGAIIISCPRNDDENIEESSERCHAKDDGRNDDVNSPKIQGERKTEKQQRSLKH